MLGVVRDLRSPRSLATPEEAAAYQEHLLAEYVLARLAHGVADGTIRGEIAAVEQFLDQAGVLVWEVEPAHADRFLGQAQRHQAAGTRRGKAKAIDLFFRFLEARYRGEICELTGRVVASPVDECNRPRHSGDFQVRVPPSPGRAGGVLRVLAGRAAGGAQVAGRRPPLRDGPAGRGGRAAAAGAVLAAAGGPALRPRPAGQDPRADGQGIARLGAAGAAGADARRRPAAAGLVGTRRSAASSPTTGSCPARCCSPPSAAGRSAATPSLPR